MIRNPYDIYGMVMPNKLNDREDEVYCSLNYSESPYQRSPEYVPASLLSSMVGGGGRAASPRQYIDPWDLENYAYLQQRRESETEEATTELYTSDDCCESTASSQFYYKGPADKQDYYNYRQQIALADNKNRSLLAMPNTCDGSCNSPLCDQNGYVTREPQLQFPPPPYEYDYDPYDLDSDAQTVMEECQECSLSFDPKYSSSSEIYQPIYNTSPPRHFSLSKKGLLQIDYSCNWNCLDMDFNFGKMRL